MIVNNLYSQPEKCEICGTCLNMFDECPTCMGEAADEATDDYILDTWKDSYVY